MSPGIGSCSRTPSFPTPRIPPFLGSPAFLRYYVGAKSPFPPAWARVYLAVRSRGVGLVSFDPVCSRLTGRGRGRWFPVSPLSGRWSLVWYGYPVFHGLPFDGLPCSATPPASLNLAWRSSDVAPALLTAKTFGYVLLFRGSITRLSISLSTLRAAISVNDARLAYGATLLAFRRCPSRWGGVAAFLTPSAVPQASASCSFLLSLSFGFCLSVPVFGGVPRRHAFHGAIRVGDQNEICGPCLDRSC